MDTDKITSLIDQLDTAVPREDGRVYINTCEPDMSVYANERGYLRLGIEFLRCGLVPKERGGNSVPVDVEYLIQEDSSVGNISFERSEEPPKAELEESFKDKVILSLLLAVLISIPLLAIFGLYSLVQRIIQAFG